MGNYNKSANILKKELGRTSNIIDEYAEYAVCEYLAGKLLRASHPNADIQTKNGKLYQVKARKVGKTTTTQLGIIRSWEFNYLAVILFNNDGEAITCVLSPVNVAKEYARMNTYQKPHTVVFIRPEI